MNLMLALTLFVTADLSAPVGQKVSDFQLDDYRGKTHALADFQDRSVVVIAFLGTECPLAKLYGPRLERLHEAYSDQGVAFIGISSNSQDSLTEVAAYARRHAINFPILKDPGNRIADQLTAKRTPEVFVLDQDRVVRYWGRIDDQFGVGYLRDEPTTHQLRDAIDALLAGRVIEQPAVESVGCYIGRVREPSAETDVTYSNQVARILQQNCVECHRDGEIAPFTLTDYHNVSAWADTIAEVVRDQRMPPWHANPEFGHFTNSRRLDDVEKQQLFEWAAAGAPEGDPADLPQPRDFTLGWRLPQPPDQVFGMSSTPFAVAAEDTVEYQYFIVDPGFEQDKWVSAAEVIPGNRAVVHHAIVFIRPPGELRRNDLGWLAAYVPGQSTTSLPEGQAVLVPAGSKFVFQMHYTPIGTEQQDLTKVGLVYSDPESVRKRVLTLISTNREFEIPPGHASFQARSWLREFPQDATLLAMAPHMHLRGKSFRFVLHDGDRQEVLLDVPNYDFNWQHSYQLAAPLPLRKGMKIECVAHFDNSEENPVNPDPSATVRWGDQTWEEMVVAYFGIAVPYDVNDPVSQQKDEAASRRKQERSIASAERMMQRFDKNQDGSITRKEVPRSFAVFAFSRFDRDNNGQISFEEARKHVLRSQTLDED